MSVNPLGPSGVTPQAQPVGPARTPAPGVGGVATPPSQPLAQPATQAPLPLPVAQALDTAKAAAATQQASLAPLMADLAAALDSVALPPTLKAAVAQVLALQTPTDAPMTGEALKQAVARSGLFLESHLASGQPALPDLKAALLVLQQGLAATGAPPLRTQRPAGPPPTRGGQLAGQGPATGSLGGTTDPALVAGALRGEVEQAVARQALHQMASLPEGEAARWMFELPLATPAGAAIAQFEIERDPPDTKPDAEERAPDTWRARFSMNLPSTGPVHVHLRIAGEDTAVALWAEDADSLDRFRARGEELAGALQAEVTFRPGSPKAPDPPPAGRFVDRSS